MINFSNSATIYISQSTGNDSFNGYSPTADCYGAGPIKSFGRLNEMINTMRSSGVNHPISVKFIGDYYMTSPLQLDCRKLPKIFSKNEVIDNITFESCGEKPARLIGGKKLTGFKKDIFNGSECLSLFLPEVKSGSWHFTDLYVNGKAAARTRYPKNSTLKAVTTEIPGGNLGDGSKWFIANKEDFDGIDGIENSIISFYHYWVDEHSPVESFDRETGKFVMKYRSHFNITVSYNSNPENPPLAASDLHYYLENIPQTFSEKGEWYLDVPEGMVYYIPRDGESADNIEVFAPVMQNLVFISGKPDKKICGIHFKNLEFICSKGDYTSKGPIPNDGSEPENHASDGQGVCKAPGAVHFEYAEACGVRGCKFSVLGIHAVEIAEGCNAVRVENCEMTELAGGGVKITGVPSLTEAEKPHDKTSNCVVRGNRISYCGRRYAAACGILVIHSSMNEISDNEISYLDYTGISVGWVWGYNPSSTYGNLIRGNHIHHIGMGNLSDMGGIYTLGEQSGTIIEENLIHDVKSAHYGGWGIYTDEGSSYINIENNVVYNTNSDCFHQHYGSHNTLRGNIFAFGGDSVARLSRREEHPGAILENNIFITDGKPVYCFGSDGKFTFPGPCIRSSNNVIWDISGKKPVMFIAGGEQKKAISLEEWQNVYRHDEGSIVEKAAIVDEIVRKAKK